MPLGRTLRWQLSQKTTWCRPWPSRSSPMRGLRSLWALASSLLVKPLAGAWRASTMCAAASPKAGLPRRPPTPATSPRRLASRRRPMVITASPSRPSSPPRQNLRQRQRPHLQRHLRQKQRLQPHQPSSRQRMPCWDPRTSQLQRQSRRRSTALSCLRWTQP